MKDVIAHHLTTIPWIRYLPALRNQQFSDSCMSIQMADVISVIYAINEKLLSPIALSSRNLMEWVARTPQEKSCDGLYTFSAAYRHIMFHGIPEEYLRPYLPSRSRSPPYIEGPKIFIERFIVLDSTEKVRAALLKGPILAAIPLSAGLMEFDGQGICKCDKPDPNGGTSFHVVMVMDWGELPSGECYYLLRNSWGFWAFNGMAMIDEDGLYFCSVPVNPYLYGGSVSPEQNCPAYF